jgi:hypothetical protein
VPYVFENAIRAAVGQRGVRSSSFRATSLCEKPTPAAAPLEPAYFQSRRWFSQMNPP